ncbi:MAG: hydroxypyruvate isomerase [Hydrogenophaga sp.]|nr:hydroxypyruvate isomerase [Hydrogenophaga sp.]
MPQFAANLSMLWTELPFLDRFDAAAKAGFKAVEFLFPYDHPAQAVADRLTRNGLQLVLHNLPPGDWAAGERGIACIPGREAEFRAGVATAAEYAKVLGTPRWHCMAGLQPAGVSEAKARATWVANVRHAAAEAKKLGIQLLIEPINSFDMPGYFVNRPRQAIALIDEVMSVGGIDNVFLQYDIYHAQRMEGELANTIRDLLPRIAHMQLADNPARNEPGTGEIHWRFLFEVIDALGYRGWIGCEYKPKDATPGGTERGLGWMNCHDAAV